MVRRGHNINSEIYQIVKINLKTMRGISRYNTITKGHREEFFEWILSRPNVKPYFVSSHAVKVLNPEYNQKEVFPEM